MTSCVTFLSVVPHAHTLQVMIESCKAHWGGCRNPAHGDVFVTASGDHTAKVWDVRQPRSTLTIAAHQHEVCLLASTAAEECADVHFLMPPWAAPNLQQTNVQSVGLLQLLAADWCKYNDCVIATGSVDKTIKTWDVRMPQREVAVLTGHTYAVRRCLLAVLLFLDHC